MAEAICLDTDGGIQKLKSTLLEMLRTVKGFIGSLEECPPEKESRFALVCGMLGGLEQNKRELDRHLTAFFRLHETYVAAKMRLTHWEGALSVSVDDPADVQQAARETAELLQEVRQQTKTSETRYLQSCEHFEGFAHGLLPRFLEDVYRLSDAEHNGNGLRAAALLQRCGVLCHEVERLFL